MITIKIYTVQVSLAHRLEAENQNVTVQIFNPAHTSVDLIRFGPHKTIRLFDDTIYRFNRIM